MSQTRSPENDAGAGSASGSPPTITALTGVRAVAAGWVLCLHFGYVLPGYFPGSTVLAPWTNSGTLGVDIFFILSGFVLSYNYAERRPAGSRRRYGSYLFARFARVYPVHLLTLLMAGGLMVLFGVRAALPSTAPPYTLEQLLANLTLLHALPGGIAWNAPAWSVGCEAVAYLLFPLGAVLLVRLRRRTALGLAALVVTVQIAVTLELGWARSSLPPLSWIRIGGEFTLGCLLWAAWRHGVRPHRRWDVVALVAAGVSVLWLGLTPLGPTSYLVVPLLGVFVVAAASSAGPVHAVLSSRLLDWGGRVSYSLYLTHWIVIVTLTLALDPKAYAGTSVALRLAILALYLVAIVVVAALTFHFVEEPSRRWLRRRAAGWSSVVRDRRAAPAATPPEQTLEETAEKGRPKPPTEFADTAGSRAGGSRSRTVR